MSKRSRHSSMGQTVNINDLVQALRQYNQNPGLPNQPNGGMGNQSPMNLGSLAGLLGGGQGGGMLSMPQMGQGMPQIPGMGQGMPQMPGMGQGMPQMSGMGQMMPQMPGMGQGMPQMGQGMPQMPGMGQMMPQMPGMGQMMPQMNPGTPHQQTPQNNGSASKEKGANTQLLKNLFEQIMIALKEK